VLSSDLAKYSTTRNTTHSLSATAELLVVDELQWFAVKYKDMPQMLGLAL